MSLTTFYLFKSKCLQVKIIGNRVISIVECLFIINKRDSSTIVMHTRQHEVGQENVVFNAIERYEKRYGFVHVLCQLIATITDALN